MHLLSENELRKVALRSDVTNESNISEKFETGQEKITITHERVRRDPAFRAKVNEAYNSKCAMCGIQLELVEAAHIIPHAHVKGTDEVNNGVTLCTLHHKAYDNGLIYFNAQFDIKVNDKKLSYLTKEGRDSGFHKFDQLSFEKLQIPKSHHLQPSPSNVTIANKIRGVLEDGGSSLLD